MYFRTMLAASVMPVVRASSAAGVPVYAVPAMRKCPEAGMVLPVPVQRDV
jgi:hypothetical protein